MEPLWDTNPEARVPVAPQEHCEWVFSATLGALMAEEVHVELKTLGVKTLVLGLSLQNLNPVLALGTGSDFGSLPDQVVALG